MDGVESAYSWLANSTRAASTITSATIGGVNGYTGAVVTGGTQKDAVAAAFTGALFGGFIGNVPLKTTMGSVLANATGAAAGDFFGQGISHFNSAGTWNKDETLGAGMGGILIGFLPSDTPMAMLGTAPLSFGFGALASGVGSKLGQ